jgi:hypothetical protein
LTEKHSVTDEQLGRLARKEHELFRRVRDGTLPVDHVLTELQRLIEGSFQLPAQPWVTDDLGEHRCSACGNSYATAAEAAECEKSIPRIRLEEGIWVIDALEVMAHLGAPSWAWKRSGKVAPERPEDLPLGQLTQSKIRNRGQRPGHHIAMYLVSWTDGRAEWFSGGQIRQFRAGLIILEAHRCKELVTEMWRSVDYDRSVHQAKHGPEVTLERLTHIVTTLYQRAGIPDH